MVSVSGVRGIVGRSMTPRLARDFAAAFATHVRERSGTARLRLCLGRDSRPSGADLAAAAAEGLAAAGAGVVDLGIVATPTVGVMIGAREADGGLVLTASHNPAEWNGIKCLTGDGAAPGAPEAVAIIDRFRAGAFETGSPAGAPPERDDTGHDVHVERVLAEVDVDAIRARGYTVVLDSVNGAGGPAGRRLLDRLGVGVVHLNETPDGHFAHPPEPVAEHLGALVERVRAEGATCGFAQDPDADRLAVVDENGRYVGEEYTLVLAARRVLDRHGGGLLAANLSTSRMIDDLAAGYDGARVVRTAVGEANVTAALRAADGLFGGEGNGGVIFPRVTWVRDSISAMALVLDLLAAEDATVSAMVGSVPAYHMIKRKFDLPATGDRAADPVPAALAAVRAAFGDAAADDTDGLRLDLDDGWLHVRPSNTEPIMRIIAEATTPQRAASLIDRAVAHAGVRDGA
jgi:phosphomannomutase